MIRGVCRMRRAWPPRHMRHRPSHSKRPGCGHSSSDTPSPGGGGVAIGAFPVEVAPIARLLRRCTRIAEPGPLRRKHWLAQCCFQAPPPANNFWLLGGQAGRDSIGTLKGQPAGNIKDRGPRSLAAKASKGLGLGDPRKNRGASRSLVLGLEESQIKNPDSKIKLSIEGFSEVWPSKAWKGI